ncbi:MAG TPA: peptidylprolyl isomerase [Acidobacteriota bacterium]|jgi:peptidyl-prolyl cis-trans isomerase D|nr:peptidylprolyl isomerase [Acidobacteriota bacterium]HQO24546.1 peptidylprolyl isomerase [Acidobacteriota bacterium]HQP72397.1 peptidylprolyl isomerase [Acidobacteriota bacterium]
MLNFIRDKKAKLKWVLWLVIIALGAGMVLMFVTTPSGGGEVEMGNYIAKVGDSEISINAYRSNLLTVLNMMGPEARRDENTIRQYGNMVLGQMIRTVVLSQEAVRNGFTVSDEEVMNTIVNSPGFNIDGNFIGTEEYKSNLKRLGISPEEYEANVRRNLLSQKLQDFLASSAALSEQEIQAKFVDENDKAKIRYVTWGEYAYAPKVVYNEADARKYYESNKDNYKIDETRQFKLLILDTNKLAAALAASVTDAEIRADYEANRAERYQEMVRASHILLKVPENATPAEVELLRQKAATIRELALRPGSDFAKLAEQYSEDEGSAKRGGDLSFFPRNRMIKEFEDATFALSKGQISEVIKSQFGFHIIQCTDRRDFDFYRSVIARNLSRTRAEQQLEGSAQQALQKARESKNLEAVAKEFGGTVELSNPFSKTQPDYSLGLPPDKIDTLLALSLNEVGELQQTSRGFLIPQLVKIIPPHVQGFDKVKVQVDRDYRTAKARELAAADARAFLAELKASGDLDKTAAKYKLTVEASELFNVSGSIANQLGASPALALEALRLEPNGVGGPVSVRDNQVVFQVTERVRADLSKLAAERDAMVEKLLGEKRRQLTDALLNSLVKQYQDDKLIQVNQPLLDRILG